MREFNGNIEKSNAARVAYDLELELIDRDLGLDLHEVIRFLASEGGGTATAPLPGSATPGASSNGAGTTPSTSSGGCR